MLNASARMTIPLALHAGRACTHRPATRVVEAVSGTTSCTIVPDRCIGVVVACCAAAMRPRPDRPEVCPLRALPPGAPAACRLDDWQGRSTALCQWLAWLGGGATTHCTFLAFLHSPPLTHSELGQSRTSLCQNRALQKVRPDPTPRTARSTRRSAPRWTA